MAAVTANWTEVAPAGTLVVAGTVTVARLLVSLTTDPPAGAALVRVTLHWALVPPITAVVHVTADSCAVPAVGGVNWTTAFAKPPLQDAAIWTSVFVVTAVAATAENVADEDPDAIVTDVGTFKSAFEDVRAIVLPVVGAGWDKLTLHVALPGATTEEGLQVSDCNVIGVDVGVTLIVPPVAVLGID